MTTPLPEPRRRPALAVVLVAAALYCLWLGLHWLPLDYSDKELAASASRVWDIQHELGSGHGLPWWTPHFMSGSSYGLNYARGFHLVPWLLLTQFFNLAVAGKLMALLAIFGGAVAMFYCARYLLKHDWAAVLAALAFLLHPEQLTRAMTQEHMPIITYIPFVPLVWWLFARALDRRGWSDVVWCVVAVVFAMWADVKQLVVQGVFMAGYLGLWCWQHRTAIRPALLTCVKIGVGSLALGACVILPGLTEQPHIKLFTGDPLEQWQKTYGLHSPLGLVDRDGTLTKAGIAGVREALQRGELRPATQQEAQVAQSRLGEVMGLQMDSPEKYAGLVVLALVVVTALFNARRHNRPLFWFAVGMLLLAVMLGSGLRSVWDGTRITMDALWNLPGVPASLSLTMWLLGGVAIAGLVWLARKKITASWQWWLVGGTLAVFLFVPGFRWLALLPYFKEIRAPGVFYSLPFAFFSALVAGFFVTDVLRRRERLWVAGLALLMLVDFWPYQRSAKLTNVPASTLQNLEATYTALATDRDWVKVYPITSRYFHLLSPQWSGKPLVYEAFYNWMCPLGMGLLNQHAGPELFNLVGARYIVVDKTAPGMDPRTADGFRQTYREVAVENEDFVVFRNPGARDYVTAFARACAFTGDVRQSPRIALALAGRGWPLVHADDVAAAGRYERTYTGEAGFVPPAAPGQPVALADTVLTRDRHGLIRIQTTPAAPCLLVIAESYYPFWRAEVNGQPVAVQRVSCGLMGLEVGAGRQEIVLRYEVPRSYALAGGVSLVTLLVGAGLVARERRAVKR